MDLIFFLVLTIPVFYVYGLYCLIKNIFSPQKKLDKPYAKKLIAELQVQVIRNPNRTVKSLLDEYLGRTEEKRVPVLPYKHPNTSVMPEIMAEPKESIWEAWYSTNSINLLLYIGAFLIVAAAAIFVGFTWETIPGIIKALLLTGCACAFFLCGIWFYSLPKIKNAGSTFIAIAAVLIPVLGIAWYTFVLQAQGIPGGIVWLITSFVAITVYVSLALYIKTPFYTYASTIGVFSIMLSLVNTFDLARDFYLLASIVSCFILLLVSQQAKKLEPLLAKTFSLPAEISSQIGMPITLFYGFFMAISEDKLFTVEGVLSAVFAGIFYAVSYLQTKETWKLALAEIIFFVAYYLGCHYLTLSQTTMYFVLAFVSLGFSGIGYYFAKDNHTKESDVSYVIGAFGSILIFCVAWVSRIEPLPQSLLALFPLGISLLISWNKKNPYPLLLSSSFFAIFLYILYSNVFHYEAFLEYLGLLYLILGVARYILTFTLSRRDDVLVVGHITIVSYCAVSLLLTMSHLWLLLICTTVIAILLFSTAVLQKVRGVSFSGVVFLFISLLLFLHQLHTPSNLNPIIYVSFAYILFAAGRSLSGYLQEEMRLSSLFIALFTGVVFFLMTVYPLSNEDLARNALISGYATILLFALDLFFYQTPGSGYVTSVVAMFILLWQIHYLGYKDTLMYSTPVGIYCMALSYVRRLHNDLDGEKTLAVIGSLFLIIPPFFLSYGNDAMKYSVILGVESILLVFIGISYQAKVFQAAGIVGIFLAVLPQTYSFILSLPRWVVVGVGGLLFLAVAIFLLLKRKED